MGDKHQGAVESCTGARLWAWASPGIAPDMPPALSPHSVTRSGSPPNAAMLSLTQAMASCWSSRPKLPAASLEVTSHPKASSL